METKVICPHCGGEISIPEQSSFASGMTIAKDSDLGTVVLPPADGNETASKRVTRQLERLLELQSKGVDISKFVALKGLTGEGIEVKCENEAPQVVIDGDLDELEKGIIEDGYVKNTRLYRRFLLSQMCHMLDDGFNFVSELRKRGYSYEWKVIKEELNTLVHLERKDEECFNERKIFFTKQVVARSLLCYLANLHEYLENKSKKHPRRFEGKAYVKWHKENIFVDDLGAKVYKPISKAVTKVKRARTYREILSCVETIDTKRLPKSMKMSPAFIDAYKGAGAYYAMKNLIMFHGCRVHLSDDVLDMYASMEYVQIKAKEHADGEGWKLFGIMRKLIEDNEFNFNERMKEIYGD